ncbi:MAG: chemotaxis protein CheA [Gammaproteobacteria bacterium]|nr:chemotaxis protein CheA [Gammaproteobacteria bacterium]
MSLDMSQFTGVFFEESFEGLDVMESGLLDMEPGAIDDEVINNIFRAAHSIKGGAGTFGFGHISEFTHVMETLLDEMRAGQREMTVDANTVLLQSTDILRAMLEASRDEQDDDQDAIDSMQKELNRILNSGGGDAAASSAASTAAATSETAPAPVVDDIKPEGWHIVFRPHENMMQTGNDPVRIIRELATLGELIAVADTDSVPDLDSLDPSACFISWDLHVRGDIEQSQVNDVFDWVEDECDLMIMPIVSAEAKAAVQAEAEKEAERRSEDRRQDEKKTRRKPTERRTESRRGGGAPSGGSIRVDVEKIDALINMVGELVITQSMLSMIGDNFEDEDQEITSQEVERLREGLGQLERHTRELQESVMQVRMLPISFTFSRFPRLVRDLSMKLEKNIELVMSGEATEVDKTVIEKIGDPLVHLVRNSLDHGIEMPADRVAAGKPEQGTINLNAYHKGGSIVIEIIDDGKGLNKEVLLDKAIEKGLVSEDEVLSDKQIYELIFMAGFSTAAVVSDVSGRGVGMDVVRRNIHELGGEVEIDSELGVGTKITIRLPLTLAILDGQTIKVGDETYIVPLITIIESIQIKPDMINRVAGKGETFKLRGEYLQIIKLHEVFGIKAPKATDLSEGIMVVVESEGRHVGLFVDDLFGQQQVVIKSLEANYKKVDGFSGATILGDGSVALILDIPGVVRLSQYDNEKKEKHIKAA